MIEIRCKKCNDWVVSVIEGASIVYWPCKKCKTQNVVDVAKLDKKQIKV